MTVLSHDEMGLLECAPVGATEAGSCEEFMDTMRWSSWRPCEVLIEDSRDDSPPHPLFFTVNPRPSEVEIAQIP